MKNLILILAIAFVAMFSSLKAEQEILWKSNYKKLIQPDGSIDPGYIYNAILTPDDKYVVVSCERRTFLVESETGKYVRDLKEVVGVIRFSIDGKFIYTYDNKKFNYETGELVGEFLNKGEKSPKFTNMDICEKAGAMIGTTDEMKPTELSKNIWIYDLKTMELLERIGDAYTSYGHLFVDQNALFFQTYGDYYEPTFPPKPKEFKNEFWDLKLRKKMLDAKLKGLGTIQTSTDGKSIGAVLGSKVAIYDVQSYNKIWETTQGGGGILTGVCFSTDNQYIATCAYGSNNDLNDIHVWEVATSNLSYRYKNHNIWNQDLLLYSNNGKYLLGTTNSSIVVYNAIYTTTNIEPIKGLDTILILPNPATNKISLDFNNNLNYTFNLIDNLGGEIEIQSISNLNNKLEINISSLSSGTYYLILTQNNISKLYKFIKE